MRLRRRRAHSKHRSSTCAACIYAAQQISRARHGGIIFSSRLRTTSSQCVPEKGGRKVIEWAYASSPKNTTMRRFSSCAAAEAEEASDEHPVTPGNVVPPRELLAEMLLTRNQPAPGLAEFERSLKRDPNRFQKHLRHRPCGRSVRQRKRCACVLRQAETLARWPPAGVQLLESWRLLEEARASA